MDTHILIVFKDLDVAETIRNILADQLLEEGREVFVDLARNEAEAKGRLRSQKYDLIITHLHIPADKKSPLKEGEQRGLSLLQSLEKDKIKIPSILISILADPELIYATQDLYKCNLVIAGLEEWEDNLTKFSKKALAPEQYEEEPEEVEEEKKANVDIFLDLDNRSWNYKLKGVGFAYDDFGVLKIDADKMCELVDCSRNIREISNWEKELHRIGEALMKEIFVNNYMFNKHFLELKNKVGGIENTRIRFIVEKRVHPIVLEALVEPDERYLMLEVPIYRKLMVPGEKYPLFHKKETRERDINCLIIEADVCGYVPGMKDNNGNDLRIERLKNITKESENFEKYLLENKDQFKIGEVKRIKEISEETPFAEHVKNILKNDTWHLVHYAGHSIYHEGKGYVFFPGDFIEKLNIEVFSKWLKETQFIYLSSCQSCEENFVFELARNKIPAIIGYRWDIDDDKAEEHAETFYQYLFKERSLEYAFLKTRQVMHDKYQSNKVWAAPMLILQVTD